MVEAVHQFEVHPFGRQFTVVTDHRALTSLFSSTVLNTKLWRWALYLQQFDIVFCYQPGKFNTAYPDRRGHHLTVRWRRRRLRCRMSFTLDELMTIQESRQKEVPCLKPCTRVAGCTAAQIFLKPCCYLSEVEMWEDPHSTDLLPHEHGPS